MNLMNIGIIMTSLGFILCHIGHTILLDNINKKTSECLTKLNELEASHSTILDQIDDINDALLCKSKKDAVVEQSSQTENAENVMNHVQHILGSADFLDPTTNADTQDKTTYVCTLDQTSTACTPDVNTILLLTEINR